MALDGIRKLSREEQIKAAAEYAGVEPSVLDGIWRVESGRGQNMLSSAGARGHFQIMPNIQATLEKRGGRKYDPYDFTDGLIMAADLMRENMQLAKGDLPTALAIYHGGTNRKNWGPLTQSYPGKVLGTDTSVNTSPTVGDSVPVHRSISEATEFGWERNDPEVRAKVDRGWAGTEDIVAELNASAADEHKPGELEKAIADRARIEAGIVTGTAEGAQGGADAAYADPGATLQRVMSEDTTVPDTTQPATSRETFRMEQGAQREAEFQENQSGLDKWGSFFDEGITAATLRTLASLGDEAAPKGWKYIDHASQYETPDLSFEELSLLRGSRSPAEADRAATRIYQRRHNARIQQGMSGGEQFGYGTVAGLTDPVNLAAGVGVGEAFNVAGIGVRAAIKAGKPLTALVRSAGEGAAGSVVVDVGLSSMGEHRTGGQFLTDAAFGALMSGAVGIKGMRDAHTVKLGNDYIADLANRNAEALQLARNELGEGADPTAIHTRAMEVAYERESRWAIASLTDVPEGDRLFPRANPGERTEATPVEGRYIAETKGGQVHLKVTQQENGVRTIEAVDAEGNTLKDSLGYDVARLIFSDEVKGEGQSLSVRVSSEFQRKGIATAMYRLARDLGGDIGDGQTGEFRSGLKATRSEEGQAFRESADLDSAVVRPLTESPSSNGTLPGALKARDRKAIISRYGLDTRISDDAERNLVAEALHRSEQVLKKNNVDAVRLSTWLQKANLEATSTTLLSSNSPVAKAIGILLLENPEGAAGRRATTAAIARSQLFEEYMGMAARQHDLSYGMWLQEKQVGRFTAAIADGEYRAMFNKELSLEMAHRQMGRTATRSAAVRAAADALDRSYLRSLQDQRFMGTVGATRLPEGGESGYFHRQWLDTKIRSLSMAQRDALREALKDQFIKVGGMYDDEFVDELATSFLERIERRAVHSAEQDATLYSSDTADILRDSLKAAGLNEEQIAKQLNRFGRGGAAHTKGRIDLDLTQEYADGEGGVFRLLDFIQQDQERLLRQYASRSAGEVALSKYGINGVAGVKMLKEALRVSGADGNTIRAFDQVMAEFLGQRVGDGDPNILTNIRMLTNATRLGGAFFPQMGTYADAMAALGPGAVLDAMGATPRLLGEVRAMAAGRTVRNPILGGLETMGADFGSSDYRIMGLGTIDEHAALSGRESIGRVTQAIRAGSNGVRILSGHRALVAVQTRGIAEQIVQKAWRYIRDGLEDKALDDMGIDAAMRAQLRQVMDDVVTFDEVGNVKVFDPDRAPPEMDAVMIGFRNAVVRGAGQLVQREFIGETGKWVHDGLLKFLMQFRTFSLIAHQKQLGRNIAVYGAPRAAMLVAGAASVVIPVHMARVALNASLLSKDDREEYLKQNLSVPVVGRQVMNYVSGLGLLPDVLDLGSGAAVGWANTFNKVSGADVELPDWAKPTGGRTMSSGSLIGGQFAPGVGLLNDYAQVLSGNLNKLRSSTPAQTLPYISPFLRGAESHLKDEDDE